MQPHVPARDSSCQQYTRIQLKQLDQYISKQQRLVKLLEEQVDCLSNKITTLNNSINIYRKMCQQLSNTLDIHKQIQINNNIVDKGNNDHHSVQNNDVLLGQQIKAIISYVNELVKYKKQHHNGLSYELADEKINNNSKDFSNQPIYIQILKQIEVQKPIYIQIVKQVEVPIQVQVIKQIEIIKQVRIQIQKPIYIQITKQIEKPIYIQIIKEVEVPIYIQKMIQVPSLNKYEHQQHQQQKQSSGSTREGQHNDHIQKIKQNGSINNKNSKNKKKGDLKAHKQPV